MLVKPTRGQIVHVLKLLGALVPGVVAAVAPGLPLNQQLVLYAVSAILGHGELTAHGKS